MRTVHLRTVARIVAWSSLAVLLASALFPSSADGRQAAGLSIGARVAPTCTISVDPTTIAEADSAGARVQCGRNALRVLRVTTDRGDGLEPVTTLAGRQLLAGGEVRVVVSQPLATVASLMPVLAPPAPLDRKPVLVTFDF
jgi:hypothetical protein